MDFSTSTFWWVLAGIAVAAELATGTFYLLLIALGLAAGALGAHLGLTVALQILLAALVGGGGTALWHWHRMHHPRSAPARENRNVNLDIGERVHVPAWEANGTARVSYRGTTWSVRLAPGAPMQPGPHLIQAVEGNWLILEPHSPH